MELKKIDIPPNLDKDIAKSLINKEFIAFLIKSGVALVAMVAGIVLIVQGVLPETDSTIKFNYNDISFELSKTYPGVVLAIISLVLLLNSKMNIKFT